MTSVKKFEKWPAHTKARRETFEKFGASADVWVYSIQEFEDLLQDFGSMPETALNTGIEV
ncbi:MAG: hypothetical protein AABY64_09540 [Bdellovibrionota bacterium]